MPKHTPLRLAAVVAVASLSACDAGPEVVPAKWASQPSAQQMADAYPAFARLAGIPGRVKMRCLYEVTGVLKGCRLLGVAPEGLKFEDAVPLVMSSYVVTPQTLDGIPAPAPIDFVVSFDPPPVPASPQVGASRGSFDGRFMREMLSSMGSRSVEADRASTVAAIIDRAYAAEAAGRPDILMSGVMQGLSAEGRRMVAARPTASAETKAPAGVSPEDQAIHARIATRMRTEYCAAYACAATLPATPPAP